MGNESLVLTEIERYVLASCDDHNVGALVARDIISQRIGRKLSLREMRQIYERLQELGLVEPFLGRHGARRSATLIGTRTRDLSFNATPEGVQYLRRLRHVV
jgi:hypothetical protein